MGDSRAARMAILDWADCAAVERVRGKMSGAWVLRGTRMPVARACKSVGRVQAATCPLTVTSPLISGLNA
jgi:hypothetical protein